MKPKIVSLCSDKLLPPPTTTTTTTLTGLGPDGFAAGKNQGFFAKNVEKVRVRFGFVSVRFGSRFEGGSSVWFEFGIWKLGSNRVRKKVVRIHP